MKIFISAVYQETNSFNPLRTDLELFRREQLWEGPEILERTRGANVEIAGFVEQLGRRLPQAEVVPGLMAWGIASGPVLDPTFAELKRRLLEHLERALPVDAVLLSLHGSMGSESCDNCEGEILAEVRRRVGPEIPIVVALDLHAVVTRRLLHEATILVTYRTYPHVDEAETGKRAVDALMSYLNTRTPISPIMMRWPAIVPVDHANTDAGPMRLVVENLATWEREGLALSASLACPHPWYDTPEHGLMLLGYAEAANRERLRLRMEQTLQTVWQRRSEFLSSCPGADEFFANVGEGPLPVAAIDAGDITTAGAVGDSTAMIREALKQDALRTLIPVVDPPTVLAAWAAGEGSTSEFAIGGTDEPGRYNSRIRIKATVRRLADGAVRFTGEAFGGMTVELGKRALLRIGSVDVLVLSHSSWLHDPALWRSVGVEPAEAHVIVQKSHKLFRPAYAEIVARIETVETPGCTDRRLSRLPYRKIPRPIFPLDDVTSATIESIA